MKQQIEFKCTLPFPQSVHEAAHAIDRIVDRFCEFLNDNGFNPEEVRNETKMIGNVPGCT